MFVAAIILQSHMRHLEPLSKSKRPHRNMLMQQYILV